MHKEYNRVHYTIVHRKGEDTMQMKLTEMEAVTAKVAMLRKYLAAKPPKGTKGFAYAVLMRYEDKLSNLYEQEVGEYRHYPGDYWEPPTDELINEDDVEWQMEEAISEATRFESWEFLDDEDKRELSECMEDYDDVIQADFNRRMAGTIWGCRNDAL